MREGRCSVSGQCGKLQLKVKKGSRLLKVTLPRKICVHMYKWTEVKVYCISRSRITQEHKKNFRV